MLMIIVVLLTKMQTYVLVWGWEYDVMIPSLSPEKDDS